MTPTDFIFLFMIWVDFFFYPSPILFYFYFFIRSESIRVDPTRTGGSELIRSDFCTCLVKMFVCPVPKYHTSWWNVAAESVDLLFGITATAELHISVDLLCGITAAELHNSLGLLCGTDLLCGTTDADLHNSPVNLLCGTTDAELNNPVWCMHQD